MIALTVNRPSYVPPPRRRGIRLPAKTVEGMKRHIIVEKPATLTDFLDRFSEYMHVIA